MVAINKFGSPLEIEERPTKQDKEASKDVMVKQLMFVSQTQQLKRFSNVLTAKIPSHHIDYY